MQRTKMILIALSVVLCERSLSAADVWSGWLGGAARTGWVHDFEPPSQWPNELQRGWQVKTGTGYASPLVGDGYVYQHGRLGEQEVVWCIDLKSGDVKWRQSYETPFKMGGGGERHGKGPKACPALSDGRLFTLSITGVLSAWDTESGKRLWQADYSSRFKKGHPYWGATTSPLVDGDRVVVHFGTDGDKQGVLVALDTKTGKEVWSHGSDAPSYASPLLAEIDGVRQVVEWNQRVLTGVEAKSGRPLWEHAFPQEKFNQNMPTPTFHDGRILLGAENRGVHCLQPRLKDDQWSVEEVWHQDKVAHDMSSAVVNEDLLFGFSHYGRGRIYCLDTISGDVLWQGPGRTGENVTFLSMPGYIAALISTGELHILAADREKYQQLATYRVAPDRTWAPPVLLQQGLLVKDHDTLTYWSFAGE